MVDAPGPGNSSVDASNLQPEDVEVPEDFIEQLAVRITVLHEKEMDPAVSSANVAQYVYEVTNHPKKVQYFMDVTEFLLEEDRTAKFAALTWAALVVHRDTHPEYAGYLDLMRKYTMDSYYDLERPEVEMNKKKYSAYAQIYGDLFGKMVEINNNLFDVIQEYYAGILKYEMDLDSKEEEKKLIAFRKPKKKTLSKKLYDDVIDYMASKGAFKSTSLNQENPNEHFLILADRLRGTRRYVMQDIMNKRALERKKQMEKELSERLVSAEEIILANEPFAQGVSLFWQEKRYNYKFLAVEKIRLALQIIGILIGLMYAFSGYLGLGGMHWFQGGSICFGMWMFVKVFGSRKRFKSFYPYDVSKELEACVGNFANTMKRMSKEQLMHFLVRQVKAKQNQSFVAIIPEFVKYLYAVMPDRKNMIITIDQLAEVMELLEVDVAKQLRSQI